MSSERKPDLQLEIAHVLFIDIVGYSKLLIDEQTEVLQELNELVRNTPAYHDAEAAHQLISLPTGDGMALVFTRTAEGPVECALQISEAIKTHADLRVRMGVHSGPVHEMLDLNQRAYVAGAGINMAQRIMDCGDAGHILLSQRVADDLAQYRHWQACLHPIGECEVKHGVVVSVVNLHTAELGNPALPEKFKPQRGRKKSSIAPVQEAGRSAALRWAAIAAVLLLFAAIGFWIFRSRSPGKMAGSAAISSQSAPTPVSNIPEKSIAVLPFENLSRDPDNGFFTDGVQDEILTHLAKIASKEPSTKS